MRNSVRFMRVSALITVIIIQRAGGGIKIYIKSYDPPLMKRKYQAEFSKGAPDAKSRCRTDDKINQMTI